MHGHLEKRFLLALWFICLHNYLKLTWPYLDRLKPIRHICKRIGAIRRTWLIRLLNRLLTEHLPPFNHHYFFGLRLIQFLFPFLFFLPPLLVREQAIENPRPLGGRLSWGLCWLLEGFFHALSYSWFLLRSYCLRSRWNSLWWHAIIRRYQFLLQCWPDI